MKRTFLFLLICLIQWPLAAAEIKAGEYLGAKFVEKPGWFKKSFLDFEDDVAEATVENKRVMLYFHQEGCPYCAQLVTENFADPEIEAYVRKHFDGITINMWGDREVVTVGGMDFTEKTFAAALKVQYTPTVIFLDEQGKVALRLNGYYPPAKFRKALNYVAEKKEKSLTFNQFYNLGTSIKAGKLIEEDFFYKESTNLADLIKSTDHPIAVFFESTDCEACEVMHKRILSDKATRELVKKMGNVQFDVFSNQKITTPSGQSMTINQWARDLGISYKPSVVFFDSAGEEVMRIEAFLKTFHFQSVFDYVLEKTYISEPSFQRYLSARGERLRKAGYDTNIWSYDSGYSSADTAVE